METVQSINHEQMMHQAQNFGQCVSDNNALEYMNEQEHLQQISMK